VQFNKTWVAGLEADFQGAGQHGSATFSPITEIFAGAAVSTVATKGTLTQKMPWFGTFRAQLGGEPSEHWLLYVTSGLAYAEIRSTATISATAVTRADGDICDILERQQRPCRMDSGRWRGVDVCQAVEREARISLHGPRPHQ
jgi:opacity protein-like surface antigen